ncbi:MAG: hypothetical protein AAF844_00195 [Pseudomonadota bacterium]
MTEHEQQQIDLMEEAGNPIEAARLRIEAQARADLRIMLQHPEMRRVLWRFFERFQPLAAVPSAMETGFEYAHREGERSVVAWWISHIEDAQPGAFARMCLENTDTRESADAVRD